MNMKEFKDIIEDSLNPRRAYTVTTHHRLYDFDIENEEGFVLEDIRVSSSVSYSEDDVEESPETIHSVAIGNKQLYPKQEGVEIVITSTEKALLLEIARLTEDEKLTTFAKEIS